MRDPISDNLKLYRENAVSFRKIFGVSLFGFWDHFLGFDVIKFDDEFVNPRDGESCKNVVLEKYGPEGLKIIKRLLERRWGG